MRIDAATSGLRELRLNRPLHTETRFVCVGFRIERAARIARVDAVGQKHQAKIWIAHSQRARNISEVHLERERISTCAGQTNRWSGVGDLHPHALHLRFAQSLGRQDCVTNAIVIGVSRLIPLSRYLAGLCAIDQRHLIKVDRVEFRGLCHERCCTARLSNARRSAPLLSGVRHANAHENDAAIRAHGAVCSARFDCLRFSQSANEMRGRQFILISWIEAAFVETQVFLARRKLIERCETSRSPRAVGRMNWQRRREWCEHERSRNASGEGVHDGLN
ncbi:MAG: hypothetical protein EBR07_08575 [Planctomycetes bacterium]|nr:hypothetical protein [Planctomycetota bacterium]